MPQLLLQCIQKLKQAGINTYIIICDSETSNRSMWKYFGVSGVLGRATNSFKNQSDS